MSTSDFSWQDTLREVSWDLHPLPPHFHTSTENDAKRALKIKRVWLLVNCIFVPVLRTITWRFWGPVSIIFWVGLGCSGLTTLSTSCETVHQSLFIVITGDQLVWVTWYTKCSHRKNRVVGCSMYNNRSGVFTLVTSRQFRLSSDYNCVRSYQSEFQVRGRQCDLMISLLRG